MDPRIEYATDEDLAERDAADKKRALAIARVRTIMEMEGFAETINLVLDISNFNGNNYAKEIKDMVYMEGRRSVFHDLLGFLEDCDPTYYARLLLQRAKELQDERAREQQ